MRRIVKVRLAGSIDNRVVARLNRRGTNIRVGDEIGISDLERQTLVSWTEVVMCLLSELLLCAPQITHVEIFFRCRVGASLEQSFSHQVDEPLKAFTIDRTVAAYNSL